MAVEKISSFHLAQVSFAVGESGKEHVVDVAAKWHGMGECAQTSSTVSLHTTIARYERLYYLHVSLE